MNKKKLYRVNIWEESGGYVDIEAESLDKAEEDVGELLLEHSFDGVMYPRDEHLVRDDYGRDLSVLARIKYVKHTHGSNEVLSVEECEPLSASAE